MRMSIPRDLVADAYDTTPSANRDADSGNDFSDNPFAGLADLLKGR